MSSFTVSVLQTVEHNAYANDPYAKEFGIKISVKLAQVEARVLSPPWVMLIVVVIHTPAGFFGD